MPVLLKSEMVRHLKKCYPPGKSEDKSPVSNELSMFIFYLQNHRSKIPKASNLILERTRHYLNKANIGDLKVTVEIMTVMVNKLNADFTLLEEDALSIVQLLVESYNSKAWAISMESMSGPLFSQYNARNRGVRFSGHQKYCEQFLYVVKCYAKIASQPNTLAENRIFALNAINSLAKSRILDTSIGKKAIIEAVDGLMANLPKTPEEFEKFSNFKEDERGRKVIEYDPGHVISKASIDGIKAFLNCGAFSYTTRIIECLLKWILTLQQQSQTEVLSIIVQWFPPQNRFIIIKVIVMAIYRLPSQNVKMLLTYGDFLEVLFKLDVSKVELSIIDVLQYLMVIQKRLIDNPPPTVDQSLIRMAIEKLRKNIGSLASVHVYPGQCGDMAREILSKYSVLVPSAPDPQLEVKRVRDNGLATDTDGEFQEENIPKSFHSTESKVEDRSMGVIINDLQDLQEVLDRATSSHDSQKMNLSVWEGTQWLLTVNHPQALTLYTQNFRKFLNIAHVTTDPSTKRGSYVFRQFCRLISSEMPATNFVAVYYCMVHEIEFFGLNAHFLLPWIFKSHTHQGSSTVQVCRNSVVLASLLATFKTKLQEEPAKLLFNFIQNKVNLKCWLPGITYPLTSPVEDAISSIANNSNFDFGEDISGPEVPDIDSLGLSEDEIKNINNPGFELDTPLDPEELHAIKGRPSSLSESRRLRSDGTANSAPSVADSQAPKVNLLRRRQTEILSLRNYRDTKTPTSTVLRGKTSKSSVISSPGQTPGTDTANTTPAQSTGTFPRSAKTSISPLNDNEGSHNGKEQLAALIENIDIGTGPRGNLTV